MVIIVGGGGAGAVVEEAGFRAEDAKRYQGVAACIFWSIVAHSAFNVYFAWYAVGGLGT